MQIRFENAHLVKILRYALNAFKEIIIPRDASYQDWIHSVSLPPFQRGKPNSENFKMGEPEKNVGIGEPKGGKEFRKKGGTQLFILT